VSINRKHAETWRMKPDVAFLPAAPALKHDKSVKKHSARHVSVGRNSDINPFSKHPHQQDMIATAHVPTFNQRHAMRLRSGLSLTKGLSNSLGIRSSRKRATLPGIQCCFQLPGLAARNSCREAAWGWAMHTLDCHVGLVNRPDLNGSKQHI
jgi:hypothetical protein